MQEIAVVNASNVVSDDDVKKVIAATQIQVDRDFLPAWGSLAVPAKMIFRRLGEIPKDAWPIYINRHSTDPGALGWHTEEGGQIYGRVFAGDCLHFGMQWSTDFGHEVLETLVDPDTTKTWAMPDGRLAAFEACDAVEDDGFGYRILDVLVSDFVLPWYFSAKEGMKYDYMGYLDKPCPSLLSGGYMTLTDKGKSMQVTKDRHDGLAGKRLMMKRWRQMRRERASA